MNEFFKSVLAVQAELKAPKGQRNEFGKYNYRSCEDIFEAVKPLLAKHGLILFASDELVEIGGRNYVKATVTLTDGETSIHNTAYAREEETKKGMDGSQITGASSSYARKYALNGLFLIDDTKDSDATNTHGKDEPKATAEQIKKLKSYVKDEDGLKAMLSYFGVKKLEDVTEAQAKKTILAKEGGNE